jgi:cytochrome P450
VVGSLLGYYRDPLGFVRGVADRYGDVALIHVAGLPFYQLSNPEDIHAVLVTKSRDFGKGALGAERRLLFGKGLATSEGDFWLRQRRLSQPAFHRERIAAYGAVMAEHARRQVESWPVGEAVDLHALIMRLALEIVSSVLFGANVAGKATEVGERLEVLMRFFASQANFTLRLLPRRIRTPGQIRFRRAVADLDRIVYEIIADRRRSGKDDGDLLATLLAARDDDDSQMTDAQLRDEVMTLFLAGHETTALALSWTFALLAQHPEVEARLAGELEEALGDRPPEVTDVPRLPYAERVLKESMRLYPPAWILARQALRDVEIGGYTIPPKAFVTMSQWVMHRDRRYFSEPERFLPGRWEDDLEKRLPKFVYFPFGGGQRVCIGSNFAMLEAILVLATIARRFRFALAPGYRLVPDPSLSLRPKGGVPGVLTRRQRLSAVRRDRPLSSAEAAG